MQTERILTMCTVSPMHQKAKYCIVLLAHILPAQSGDFPKGNQHHCSIGAQVLIAFSMS